MKAYFAMNLMYQFNVTNLQNVYILMGKPKSNFHLGLLAGIGIIIAIDGTIYFKAILFLFFYKCYHIRLAAFF